MNEQLSLYSAHFQLTGRCNLACRFCGQRKGMLASSGSDELCTADWLRCADELKCAAKRSGHRPEIMLWGGEPLLYPEFDLLAETLAGQGFSLGIVTNGTLLEQHADVVCEFLDRIFVSIDGGRTDHDAMRGAGVYDRAAAGLSAIRKRRGKLVLLCTISDLNVDRMAELPDSLMELNPDEIVFQPLIYLSKREIDDYRNFSKAVFQCDYSELTAWQREDDLDFQHRLSAGLKKLEGKNYPVPVRFTPHCHPLEKDTARCQLPLHHVHIRHDGAVGFCTDYFGFSAGNVREASLATIFGSSRANLFRQAQSEGRLSICRHCPWCPQQFGSGIPAEIPYHYDFKSIINNQTENQKCRCLIG